MGPPRDRGGRVLHLSQGSWISSLQWGRLVIEAEGVVPHSSIVMVLSLQWGRLVIEAEGLRVHREEDKTR